jgi:signal transduction histidine kinase
MSLKHIVKSDLAVAAFTCLGFFVLGYGGIRMSGGVGHNVAVIWPATAFGVCVLLRQSRGPRRDAILLAAVLLGGLAANGVAGAPFLVNLSYSITNVLEILAGVCATRSFAVPRFRTIGVTLRFALAAGIAPVLLGAALAALINAVSGNPGWFASGLQWFCANVLAFCMLFPFGMTISFRQFAKLNLARRAWEAAIVFAGLTAAAWFAFRLSPYPVQFLVLTGVLVATVRFRVLGAGIAMILVSVIALTAPDSFGGPNNLAHIELLQLFLAVCSITSVRAAIVLNQRDLHLAINEILRNRAVRASRFKSQLLSHVSHEVRSPLSAVIGFSSMLESGSLPAASAQQFAQIIVHNGELLRRLHDDLLDLSRADAGKLSINPERVTVADALRSCVGAIRLDTSLGGKELVLEELEDGLAVNADPLRLAQIMNNLIANAYKYGDNFSPITVRARRLDDGFGRIEIVNEGPGIPARERQKVFEPFGRGEQVGRRVPGAGLGLSIAKLLAEKQGGRIDFESVPGQQTCFWIDLPLAA